MANFRALELRSVAAALLVSLVVAMAHRGALCAHRVNIQKLSQPPPIAPAWIVRQVNIQVKMGTEVTVGIVQVANIPKQSPPKTAMSAKIALRV